MPPKATSGKGKGGNADGGDDQSQVTAATLDTKLSADTLRANQHDDVSVLQEDESVTLGKLDEEEEKGGDEGGSGGDPDEHDDSDGDINSLYDEDGEEEKKSEGEEEVRSCEERSDELKEPGRGEPFSFSNVTNICTVAAHCRFLVSGRRQYERAYCQHKEHRACHRLQGRLVRGEQGFEALFPVQDNPRIPEERSEGHFDPALSG